VNQRAPRQQDRGSSLLEVMATMAVMAFGIVSLAMTVSHTAGATRKNLRLTHGQMVAERVLEELTVMGCATPVATDPNPCFDLVNRDRTSRHFWVSAEGDMAETTIVGPTDPNGRTDRQYYHVAIDVDPPFEGAELGDPQVTRPLALGSVGRVVNVRVTVSWLEPTQNTMQTAILQTRVSPGRVSQ